MQIILVVSAYHYFKVIVCNGMAIFSTVIAGARVSQGTRGSLTDRRTIQIFMHQIIASLLRLIEQLLP